jgi:glyoxylase-like metal-dependent hydrolase (beta-lactamase superfamily II)
MYAIRHPSKGATVMREILPGILTWTWFSEPHGYDFNGYLVRDPGGNLVVDPVPPGEDGLDEIARAGVACIVLTNRNHSRAANAVRERTGARTLMHAADAAFARGQGAVIDGDLTVGARVGPFTVVAAAGKSPGEVALHWPQRRLLVVGDAVIGNPPGHCTLLREKVMDDPAALRRSVRRLLDLDFDALLVGDGTPILEGAKARLAELVASFAA